MTYTKFNGSKSGNLTIALMLLMVLTVAQGAKQVAVNVFGDYAVDLVHVNASDELRVEVGDGSGGFAAPVTVNLNIDPVDVNFGEFNSDGLIDLVALDSSGDLSISLNNGTNGFLSETVLSLGLQLTENIVDFQIGDIDGDGNQDIAVSVAGLLNGRVVLLYGDGLGGFAPNVDIELGLLTLGTVSFEIVDLNTDGVLDLVLKDTLGTLHLVLSDGGTYQVPSTLLGLPLGVIYFTDFNNDQIPDMIVLQEVLGVASVKLGNGDGTFIDGVNLSVGLTPTDLVTVDLNLDGNQDLVVVNLGDESINVFIGDGLGGLVELVGTVLEDLIGILPGLSLPISLVSGDFNGDCRIDMAIWNSLTESYVIQLNQSGPDPSDLIFCSLFEYM